MTDLNSKDYDLIHAAEILIMYAEAGNLAKDGDHRGEAGAQLVTARENKNRHWDWDGVPWRGVEILVDFVPRLIKSYEDVLEASMQLTELVARLLEEQQKSSLFIPPTGSGWSKQKNW